MVQSIEPTENAAASKSRKKKSKAAKRVQAQASSWPRRAVRGVLALAGLALIMGVGAMVGRASARA